MKTIAAVVMLLAGVCGVFAEEMALVVVPTTAVLSFEVREPNAKNQEMGKIVAELLAEELGKADIDMVERAELDKALAELHLSAIGLVNPESQSKIGRLTGAKILITGAISKIGNRNLLQTKIIGSETSRVYGMSVSGSQDFTVMVPELAKKIIDQLQKNGSKLLPEEKNGASVATALAGAVKGNGRKVYVKVSEDISVSTPDPAAETELKKLFLALGFKVVESELDADCIVSGEGVATSAGNYRTFTSASARLELNVFQQKNKEKSLLGTGACKNTIAGPSYVVAAKDALAQCALQLAGELFPVLK